VKVYYEAYGCSQNIAETGMLAQSMGEIVSNPSEADIILIGTCVVIEHTEHRMLRRIEELKKFGNVVVYGCLPSARSELISKDVTTIRTWEFDRAHEILGLGSSPMNEIYMMDSVVTIPIANGCLGSCTYCLTRLARGRVRSRNEKWIISMVREAVARGAKEIRLSAQDTAAYGRDADVTLPELLNKISEIEGEFRVRVGMMEPREALRILDSLISAYTHEKIYKFLHLPVQSGDDEILKRMNRGYTVDDFIEIVNEFRKVHPNILISTDVIVGFPGESDESVNNTVDMLKKIRPEILNITRFSPRPKTPAYKWKRPSTNDVKRWSKWIGEIHSEIIKDINSKFVGQSLRVLVPQRGKRGNFVGRTNEYRPVILKNVDVGKFYDVRIVESRPTYLVGELIPS